MGFERELQPVRNLVYAFALLALCTAAILGTPVPESPFMHTFLDSGLVVVSGVLALLLWDIGWRTDDALTRLLAVTVVVTAAFELFHILTSLEFSRDAIEAARLPKLLRPVTWPPTAHVMPIGLCAALLMRGWGKKALPILLVGLSILGVGMLFLFDSIPPYSPPTWLGITRPSLASVPFLSLITGVLYWRVRKTERLGRVIALFAILAVIGNTAMLYSQSPADAPAMIAHAARLANGLFLLSALMQMGTIDTARRMQAERDLTRDNVALEDRVRARTADLEAANFATSEQLRRLKLLHQTTHAIAEREGLASIYQVVVANLEDHLNVDFSCLCHIDQVGNELIVACVGPRSTQLAKELGLAEAARIEIDQRGLGPRERGALIYVPDLTAAEFAFATRLAGGGLRSLVAVPLTVEQRSGIFGVLFVARRAADGFSASDREFLEQLGENVALASNQAQLHSALQKAYEDLRDTQEAVLQQERLRALGQMASGIAHDINNAISPATLYVESILERAPGLDQKTRGQLETVQRAIGDVAQTVARMGEFYRQRESRASLEPVNVNVVLRQMPDLTRARWSDLAQARGAAITMHVEETSGTPTIMANESELREALINLIFNAADALPSGGKITLRASRKGVDGSGSILVEVCDDGVGMDENTRSHCLEPFFTTKGVRGTGLGLAMVYGIAQRHRAELQVDSAIGEGTTIRIVFPDAAGATITARREANAPVRELRLLLIDDDPMILQSLRSALEYEGHQVTCANGGQAGIDMFRAAYASNQPFSAVITDLGMPHVDGRQVASAIRTIEQGARIIMLTGWGQLLADGTDAPAHVDRILSKPPNMLELREALAQASNNS